jgi:hypothetical protein
MGYLASFHDKKILHVTQDFFKNLLVIELADGVSLEISPVIVFRMESLLEKNITLTADALYWTSCSVENDDLFIKEAENQLRIDGRKKWGDFDKVYRENLLHIYIYCIDW